MQRVNRERRRRPGFRGLVVLLPVLALGARASAQEPLSLTLEDAVARGLANSMRIAELQARREAADAALDAREAARLPALALVGGYTRTNHVDEFGIALPGQPLNLIYPDIPDNGRGRLDLQWPIYTGGRLEALERAARAQREASGEELAAARADLRLEIARAFWAVVTARRAEEVLRRSLESVDAHVRDLRTRLDQGLIPPNDVLSAEAQQSRERLFAIEATNTRRIAEADLRRLLGIEGERPIEPRASLDPSGEAAPELSRLIAEARERRPERRALARQVDAADAGRDAAAAGALPQVAVNAGYDYARPNPRIFPRVGEWRDSWDVSINVSWTLWDGGRVGAGRAEAAAAARAAESRAADFDRQLEFEVQLRRLELDSSRASVPVAEDGVRAAVEARRVVGERFAAGVATSTDVLDAERDVLEAELARTRALANVRLAEARLARAVGR